MKAVVAHRQLMTLTTSRDAELHGEPESRADLESLSDVDLLRLMSAGHEPAFVTLYRRHQRSVYRFALLMSGAAAIAEEVTQEVFLAMIHESHRYQPERASLGAYLYGVARNHVLRVLRRDRSLIQLVDEMDDSSQAESFIAPDDPFRDFTRSEIVRLVRQAVLSLPSRYREVVVLCDFQELTIADAAAVLDCPAGTVNSRLHRAHALLVKKLGAQRDGAAVDAELRCFG